VLSVQFIGLQAIQRIRESDEICSLADQETDNIRAHPAMIRKGSRSQVKRPNQRVHGTKRCVEVIGIQSGPSTCLYTRPMVWFADNMLDCGQLVSASGGGQQTPAR
jgi:hypothetical protein